MGIFDRLRGGTVRIRILIRDPGAGIDIDQHVRVPAGTALGDLLSITDSANIPLRDAVARSPQLIAAMAVNGAACPLPGNEARALAEGDEISLIAPPG